MRTQRISMILAALLFAVISVHAEPFTYSGRMDIGGMLAQADTTYDMAAEDVVVLLAGQRETITLDGRRSVMYHRIVRITTDYGIEHYADLRIPFDSKRQELDVKALRVWRESEQRWIEHRPTAIVETTPYETGDAPAYASLRETMLLHDGVELPCVLEAAYVITDKEPYRLGVDGMYIFPEEEPTLWSWMVLELPESISPMIVEANGVPSAETSQDVGNGLKRWSWKMGPLQARPDPETSDPAAYLPHVTWSTWSGWPQLGSDLERRFREGMVLNKDLSDSVKSWVNTEEDLLERCRSAEEFVKRSVAFINYPDEWFWPAPRKASDTWETAYGAGVDRAVLMAALVQEAGLQVWPVFRGLSTADVDEGIATIARMEPVGLWISGEGVEALYKPADGKLTTGLSPIFGRSLWFAGKSEAPEMRGVVENEVARIEINVLLNEEEENKLVGDGHFTGYWTLNPFDAMSGDEEAARETLEKIVGGVIDGAEVGGYNTTTFDLFTSASGFEVSAELDGEDAYGRTPLVIGDPGMGLFTMLPGDVHLYQKNRGTPVFLQNPAEQSVEVQIDLTAHTVYNLPQPVVIENEAGRFELRVQQEGTQVLVKRTLSLDKRIYQPEEWPALRELLLAEKDEANRTILLK